MTLVGTHGIFGGETKLICTPESKTVDNTDATWSKGNTDLTTGDKYTIAKEGDTSVLTILNTDSTDVADYKCNYKGQIGFFTLEASSIQGKVRQTFNAFYFLWSSFA